MAHEEESALGLNDLNYEVQCEGLTENGLGMYIQVLCIVIVCVLNASKFSFLY